MEIYIANCGEAFQVVQYWNGLEYILDLVPTDSTATSIENASCPRCGDYLSHYWDWRRKRQ